MNITPEEIHDIRKGIIDGIDAARKGGIVCDYPDSFTVTKPHNGNDITITVPIWTEEHKKLK